MIFFGGKKLISSINIDKNRLNTDENYIKKLVHCWSLAAVTFFME